MRGVLLLVLGGVYVAHAPRGLSPWGTSQNTGGAVPRLVPGERAAAGAAVAVAAAGVCAAAACATAVMDRTQQTRGGPTSKPRCKKGGFVSCPERPLCNTRTGNDSGPAPMPAGEAHSSHGSDSEGDEGDWEDDIDADVDGRSDEGNNFTAPPRRARVQAGSAGKLWSKVEFPEGCAPIQASWDMDNLLAAQNWSCPCADRSNCISADRLSVLELYEYRKKFLTTCANEGGKRDATRKEMSQHADGAGNISRSFVVGPVNDCCVASAGLAKGISFGTWASARADLRRKRPMKVGRKRVRVRRESMQRRTLEAYIRMIREGMEGAKGRDAPYNWSTGKRTVPKRWADYRKFRIRKKLPVIGSLSLFAKLWKKHDEIHEFGAKGHPKCDECGKIEARRDALEERRDEAAVQMKKDLDLDQEEHDLDHRGERDYASDIWAKAESFPERVTALNFDAPTEDEFDVPVQRRMARDVVKSLEGMRKWSSKIMGVMSSG